ncbi:MAG: glycoside hydrolase family 27 protein, partial [Mycobacterium sp.]|nr:glycoside hydrolase family 27 protein [Mycobacterium sp.]
DEGQALRSAPRPMVYSMSTGKPALVPWTWAQAAGGNMWRTDGDYGDTWPQVLANLDQEAPLAQFAGPGHWNDPDILQVGRGGMTTAQDQAHFSAWAMLAAPLLAGNDLRSMS